MEQLDVFTVRDLRERTGELLRDTVEIAAEIRAYHLGVPGAHPPMDRSHCVQGAAAGTVGKLLGLEVGLKEGTDGQQTRSLTDHAPVLEHDGLQ